MEKTTLSSYQLVALMSVFIFSNSTIFGTDTLAGKDSWIVVIIAAVMAIPFYLLYSRIIKLNKNDDFFEMLYKQFGNKLGAVLTAILVIFGIYLAASVMRTTTEYIALTAFNTPLWLVIRMVFIVVVIYLVKSGETVMGKWGTCVFFITVPLFILISISVLNMMDLNNILPILKTPKIKIVKSAINTVQIPFLESFIFIGIFPACKEKEKTTKIFLVSLAISAGVILLSTLRNLLLLGEPLIFYAYFPSYISSKILHVGDFLSRLEKTTLIFTIVSTVTRVGLLVYFCAKGFKKLLGYKNYEDAILPIIFLTMGVSSIVFESMIEQSIQIQQYKSYVYFFEIVIPVIIWVKLELSRKKIKPAKKLAGS